VSCLRTDVVALYVDPLGPYPRLVAEWYDETRDARTYAGPLPVVAHPPCGPWGRNSFACTKQDAGAFAHALEMVQRFGGILEHPEGSRAFAAHGIWPTEVVDQVRWGHACRKRTWLYAVRCMPAGPLPPARAPTHWCRKRPGQVVPSGIRMASKQIRRRTPPAFAVWLLDTAAKAGAPAREAA
jgi:hypothetical protein